MNHFERRVSTNTADRKYTIELRKISRIWTRQSFFPKVILKKLKIHAAANTTRKFICKLYFNILHMKKMHNFYFQLVLSTHINLYFYAWKMVQNNVHIKVQLIKLLVLQRKPKYNKLSSILIHINIIFLFYNTHIDYNILNLRTRKLTRYKFSEIKIENSHTVLKKFIPANYILYYIF